MEDQGCVPLPHCYGGIQTPELCNAETSRDLGHKKTRLSIIINKLWQLGWMIPKRG